jgi:DNA-directed RNA polymerase specialized sigma24 family protein
MAAAAIAFRPQLLMRARELCGRRADLDAEDLVGAALLAMVAKPPSPKTQTQLLHWMRRVVFRLNANAYRNRCGVELESWDAIQEAQIRTPAED